MSDEELYALIDGDATAKALAIAGNDLACAERCREIANPVRKKLQLSKIGVIDIYTAAMGLSGATLANQVLDTISSVSVSNSLIAKIYDFTQAGTHPDSLPNWASESLQAILMAPVQQGGCGLTQQQLQPILDASFMSPIITASDISRAWRGAR